MARENHITVRGLFETHLTVADLPRSVAFYRDVVGLPVALELPERGAAFHWIGRPGQAMLGLWTIGSAPIAMQLHLAFDVALADVLAAPEALRAHGVDPLSFFGEPTDEPSVIGWMPAAAVYFRDPDGHMLEYLAMLDGPARPDLGVVGWSQVQGYTPPAPMIKPVTVSVEVPQDRESVFDFLDVMANHESFTDHLMRDWQLSGPERGVGAKARVHTRALGISDTVDIEVVDAEPPQRIIERNAAARAGRVGQGTYTLESLASGGTRVTFEYRWIHAPLGDRLTAPLTRAYIRRANGRAMRRLADQLAGA